MNFDRIKLFISVVMGIFSVYFLFTGSILIKIASLIGGVLIDLYFIGRVADLTLLMALEGIKRL